MIGYKYHETSGTWRPDPRQAHLRSGDFEGDASRFGKRIENQRGRIRVKGSTIYVGTAQNPCPKSPAEHVLPFKGNHAHHARGGSFGAIVDAVRDGRMKLSDIGDPKLAFKVAKKL